MRLMNSSSGSMSQRAMPNTLSFVYSEQMSQTMICRLVRVELEVARAANAQRRSGLACPYTIIPFADGSDPTAPPHKLTPLMTVLDITGLAGPAAMQYCVGYGINPVPDSIVACRNAIRSHIGCRSTLG